MDDSRDILGTLPSYINVPKGVFRDVDHYRVALAGITKGLARSRRGHPPSTEGSYLFDGIQVEFSSRYVIEEVFLDHLNSKIILRAPKKPRETEKELATRRMYYLGHLLREVEAMKVIGITQIYLALSAVGRKKLEYTKESVARPKGGHRVKHRRG